MTNATCKDCGGVLSKRQKESKRPGEILLICSKGHKWQAREAKNSDGSKYLHLYRSNWKGQRGEGRRVATITISKNQDALMDALGIKQQKVFELGIDLLRDKQ